MPALKTKKTTASVDSYLEGIADLQQRKDAVELVKIMRKITGEAPHMWGPSIVGFGQYHYVYDSGHEGDSCLTGFSARKSALTIYFNAGLQQRFAAQMKKLGKCKTSKGCLYVKRLSEIDTAVLSEMIEANVVYLLGTSKQSSAAKEVRKRAKGK